MSLLAFLDFLTNHAELFELRATVPRLAARVDQYAIEYKEHQDRYSKEIDDLMKEHIEYEMNSFKTRCIDPLKKQLVDAKEKCKDELQEQLTVLGKTAGVSDEHIQQVTKGRVQFVINCLMLSVIKNIPIQ